MTGPKKRVAVLISGRGSNMTALIEAAAGRRALFYPGWSGVESSRLPENFCVLGETPHDWLFARVSAVVHHGSSGTSHSACRAGAPSVVVPFIYPKKAADAQDAFQATFVVLMRKAHTVARGSSLVSWLHRVAWTTALNVRKSTLRKKRRELPLALGTEICQIKALTRTTIEHPG